MKRMLPGAAAGLVVTLALSSCAGNPEPARTVVVTETVVVTATPSPSPSQSPDVDPEAGADLTARVQALAGDRVTAATEDFPGEFVIETDLVDARGDDSSAEALIALEICEVLVDELGATNVRVQEEDGSTFVVLGGAYKECTEV